MIDCQNYFGRFGPCTLVLFCMNLETIWVHKRYSPILKEYIVSETSGKAFIWGRFEYFYIVFLIMSQLLLYDPFKLRSKSHCKTEEYTMCFLLLLKF